VSIIEETRPFQSLVLGIMEVSIRREGLVGTEVGHFINCSSMDINRTFLVPEAVCYTIHIIANKTAVHRQTME
jgi:hypothetical protein